MRSCLLDTSIVIAYERGTVSSKVLESFDDFFLPAIVVSELLVGAYYGNNPVKAAAREAFVEGFIAHCTVLPFDEQVARVHARVHAVLRREGRIIGAYDLLIAATALAHRMPLFTLNRKEFKQISDLLLAELPVF